MRYSAFTALAFGMLLCAETQAQIASIPASPSWSRAMPNGPDATVRIAEEYAKHVGRDAYFWAWPLVNIYNRRLSSADQKQSPAIHR